MNRLGDSLCCRIIVSTASLKNQSDKATVALIE